MPKLTQMVRSTAYPARAYDIYYNTLVFRSPDYHANDTDVPHEMLQKFRQYWGPGENTPAWAEGLGSVVQGHQAAVWPELDKKEKQAKAGEICNEATKSSLFETGHYDNRAKPVVELPAFESAWAAHFYGSQ